jgi:NAD(P)-dependent dehydrogenase (short-subunit alcohol dehydrogenase family)
MAVRTVDAAIVTGAASGIGDAALRRLREDGLPVVGVDLADGAQDERTGWVRGDVAASSTWESVGTLLAERGWHAATLVTAAACVKVGTLLELGSEAWARTLDVNVMGLVLAARAVLPGMIARRAGSIVTVGSIDSMQAEQGMAAYCASKGAIVQIARALALDHARDGIRVNCVSPGVTDTPLFRQHLATARDPEKLLDVRRERNPMGRLLAPDEIAAAIAFLASPAASGITGANILVDAGLTAGFDFRTPASGA